MRVWEVTKKLSMEQECYERPLTLGHPGFEALLQRVMADAGSMSCQDVAFSLLAAVRLGYWKDPYLPSLVRSAERRTPEINRGYFARVRSIDSLIQQFLSVSMSLLRTAMIIHTELRVNNVL